MMPAKGNASHPAKLLEQISGRIQVIHYSIRTEKAYVYWIKRFTLFHNRIIPNPKG